jgi:hypothetical protein
MATTKMKPRSIGKDVRNGRSCQSESGRGKQGKEKAKRGTAEPGTITKNQRKARRVIQQREWRSRKKQEKGINQRSSERGGSGGNRGIKENGESKEGGKRKRK